MGHRMDRSASGWACLPPSLLPEKRHPGNGLERAVGTEAGVSTISADVCGGRVLPVALFWFGFIVLRKDFELGGGGKMKSLGQEDLGAG